MRRGFLLVTPKQRDDLSRVHPKTCNPVQRTRQILGDALTKHLLKYYAATGVAVRVVGHGDLETFRPE